jgi:hypothetical protein
MGCERRLVTIIAEKGRGGTISVLGSKILVPAFLALLIGGCPKRQTTPRIVYVQAPPAPPQADASAVASPGAGTLTIQEPERETAEETSTSKVQAAAPTASPSPKKSKPRTTTAHDTGEKPPSENTPPENTPPAPEAAPTPAPLQLQPEGGDVQEDVLTRRLDELGAAVDDLQRRTDLSKDQLRAASDAVAFRTQALDALRQHDLLRAKQLTDKAALLINAVQGHP